MGLIIRKLYLHSQHLSFTGKRLPNYSFGGEDTKLVEVGKVFLAGVPEQQHFFLLNAPPYCIVYLQTTDLPHLPFTFSFLLLLHTYTRSLQIGSRTAHTPTRSTPPPPVSLSSLSLCALVFISRIFYNVTQKRFGFYSCDISRLFYGRGFLFMKWPIETIKMVPTWHWVTSYQPHTLTVLKLKKF